MIPADQDRLICGSEKNFTLLVERIGEMVALGHPWPSRHLHIHVHRPSGLGENLKSDLKTVWRDVRVVEGARLESVYTLTRIEGSNPSLSAIFYKTNNNELNQSFNGVPYWSPRNEKL